MENQLLTTVASNCIFGALFIWLLRDTMKKNDEREKKYQDIIDKLTDKFEKIEQGISEIKKDIKELGKGE